MSKENPPCFGAFLERGKILAIETDSNENITGYTVESYDRPGVIARGLTGQSLNVQEGAKVYFFLFNDGTGFIQRPI